MPRAPRAPRMIARGLFGMINSGTCVGTWRSLVAHSAGGRVVAGSNPAVPTPRGGTMTCVERPDRSFGHTLSTSWRHRVLRRDRRLLLRRVHPAGLYLGPPQGRRLRRQDASVLDLEGVIPALNDLPLVGSEHLIL